MSQNNDDVSQWEKAARSAGVVDTASQIRNNVQFTQDVNPDKAANVNILSRFTGTPAPAVASDITGARQQVANTTFDADKLAQDFPHTAKFLTNFDNMGATHDDIPTTANVEKATKDIVQPMPTMVAWNGGPSDTPTIRERLYNWWSGIFGGPTAEEAIRQKRQAEANAIIVGKGLNASTIGQSNLDDDQAWHISKNAIGGASQIPEYAAERFIDSATGGLVAPIAPTKSHSWQTSVAGGVADLLGFIYGPAKIANGMINPIEGNVADSVVKALGKDVLNQGATLGLASGIQQSGHALLDSRSVEEGVDHLNKSIDSGFATGAIFGTANRLLPDNTLTQWIARALGVSVAQDYMNDQTPWDNRPLEDKVFNYGLNALFTLHGAGRVQGGWIKDNIESKIAEQDFKKFQDLSTVAAASKLRERDPQAFNQFVQDVTESGRLQDVYIDAATFKDVLNQSGVSEKELADKLPTVAEQLHEADQTQGFVRIPVADYATHIAGGPLDPGLLPNLKTDPNGKTYEEAKAFYQSQDEQLAKHAQKIVEDMGVESDFAQSSKRVKEKIQQQLDELNRFKKETNDKYAQLHADFYTTLANRLGITPEQAYERHPIEVKGESLTGNQFMQNELDKDLMVIHNLSADNLLHATKMGGIPVPSLAITKKNAKIDRFGEITLIGNHNLANPKGYAKTKVFGADIYSPRYPSVVKLVDTKETAKLNANLKAERELTNSYEISADDIRTEGIRALEDNNAVMAKFLNEKGIAPDVVQQKSPMSDLRKEHLAEQGLGKYLGQRDWQSLLQDAEFKKLAVEAWNKDSKASENELAAKFRDGFRPNPDHAFEAEQDPERAHNIARILAQEIARDAETEKKADRYGTRDSLRRQIESHDLTSEYRQFAEDTLQAMNPQEKIFKGFTYSGKRSYSAHTLENVVRILKKDLRGGENFNYGIGSLRAKFTPEFKSIEQIRKNKDRLLDTNAFEEVKAEMDHDLEDLSNELGLSLDQTIGMLEDMPKMGIQRAAEIYDKNIQVSEDAKLKALEFVTRLRNMPTEYFEAKILRDVGFHEFSGAVVPKGVDPRVVMALNENGIKDIKFYKSGDELDRADRLAEFDHLFFQDNRGAYNPENQTIGLFKSADLSTFLHESGHFFLDSYTKIADELIKKFVESGEENLTDGEKSIIQDVEKLFNWMGVKDAAEWSAMTVDQQRAAHEKFAEAFESYLFDGKAPSVELQSVFQSFRSWLLNVYKSAMQYLTKAGETVTPEIREVFDRMLASEEQIKQAEQIRNYEALFRSQEQSGLSPEDYAKYLKLNDQATADAIDELQARTMRDMKYLENAKSRMLKEMQRKVAGLRKEVRAEVSQEVMSEPVYRARELLKRGDFDGEQINGSMKLSIPELEKMYGEPKQERIKKQIERNHFMNFLVKHGINIADRSDVGGDKKGKYRPGLFRKNGERLDILATYAEEAGYLTKEDIEDPNDNGGVNKLSDMISRAIGGEKIMTAEEALRSEMEDHAAYQEELAAREKAASAFADESSPVDEVAGMRALGFSDAEIADMLAKPDYKKLGYGKYGMLSSDPKTAVSPEIIADMFGFKTGDELVRELLKAPDPREVIEKRTDERLIEKHGEIASPDAMERAANVAIHNEARAMVMATELKGLAKAVGPARKIAEGAKEAAEAAIAAKRLRDIKPGQYDAAEARAGKRAEESLAKGDIAQAAVDKRAQILNNRLSRAASDALDDVRKGLNYLAKFDKDTVREKIDVDYRDQIDGLLDRYDLRKSVSNKALDRRASLLDFVERMSAQGYEPGVPDYLLNEAYRTHYKNLTMEEFRGLVDSVKSIEHLGRLKNQIIDLQERRNLDQVATEAAQTMAELPQRSPESNRGLDRIDSALLKLKSMGRSAQASLLKMEQMMDWLDDRNPNGAFNRVVFRRISEAGVKENDMLVKIKGEIDKLLESNLADVTKDSDKIYVADALIDSATGTQQRFTKKEMLMLAGNMGNESNMSKLLRGEGWREEAVWDFLNKNMTKADWDFVAGLGKALESLWPEKVAMTRRLGNSTPDKIEPRPFDVDAGHYDGWYWPMIYDPARAQDVAERGARKGDMMFENIYTRANTDTGRTNTRNEGYARPLLLNLDAMPKIIKEEIHDIAFREAVMDADKFLSHASVRDGIVSALSQEHYDQLRPWLQSIANDGKMDDPSMRAAKFFNDVARGARTRATIVGLGYRISTMLVHGSTALAESVAELGPKWMAEGTKDFANPTQWTANKEFIFDRSGEMRNRMNEVDRDVRDHLRQLDLEMMNPATSKIQRGADMVKAHAYMGIAMLDMASALPTWMGAYKKAMTPEANGGLGLSEADAIYYADKTVRNAHGGTGVKDLAAVQRGNEFWKLFTMFYTFWNHNVNRIMDTARLAKDLPETYRSGDMQQFRGDLGIVIMRSLIYTIGAQAIHAALHPSKDDETGDTNWFAWAGKELTMAAFAGVPIARDLVSHYIGGKDYSVTPAAGMVDAIGRSGKDAMNAAVGENVSDKWVKHAVVTAGYVFGLPTGQAANATQFLWDVASGTQNPDDMQSWWNGIVHGEAHYSH